MESILCTKLRFSLEPVAVSFTDRKPEGAFQAQPGRRVCAAAMLVAAGRKGTVSAFDEETYGCPGAGTGLCFGNGFVKKGMPIDALLSRGDEVLEARGETYFRSLGMGERFFDTPELARRWAESMPYAETPQRYVVFEPLSKLAEDARPDLVHIFANADQLSALVTMAGFFRGKPLNTLAPFCAACQSILLAYREIGREEPHAIMGFFDISQRAAIPKELLSFVVPFAMFREIERAAADGCLETPAWKALESRLG